MKLSFLHKRLLLFICCIFIFSESFSQDSLTNNNYGYAFSLRGKAFGFFIIEDTYFATFTLGGELIYNKKHSLGIDGTLFRWRYQTDDSIDVEMYDRLEKRTYLLIDYKYAFISFHDDESTLYFNVYDKTGNYKMWHKAYNYDHHNDDMTFLKSTTKGTFNELGMGIGIKKYLYDSPLGFDCSANVTYLFTNNDEHLYVSKTQTDFKTDKHETWGFYMRLNLFYNFNR